MKFIAVLFLVVACICSAGVLAKAKPIIRLLEMARIRGLQRRLARAKALAPVTAAAGSTTPAPITPSAALVAAAAAQGVSLADLQALTPAELAQLQAEFNAGLLNN